MSVNLPGIDAKLDAVRNVSDNSTTWPQKVYDLVNSVCRSTLNPFGSAALKDTGNNAGQIPVIQANGKLADAVLPTIASSFTDLTDTPGSFSGQAGKLLKVNSAGNAIEFSTTSGLVPVTVLNSASGVSISRTYSAVTAASANINQYTYIQISYSITESGNTYYSYAVIPRSLVSSSISTAGGQAVTNLEDNKLKISINNNRLYAATFDSGRTAKIYAVLGVA